MGFNAAILRRRRRAGGAATSTPVWASEIASEDGLVISGEQEMYAMRSGGVLTTGTLDSLLTYTSPASKYVRNSSGIYEAGTTIRCDYDEDGNALGFPIEQAATILGLHNRDLSQSAWTKTNTTAAKTATGVTGDANSASRLTATANNGTCLQSVMSSSVARVFSPFIKRVTGTGTIEMTLDNGSTWTDVTTEVTSSWRRIEVKQTLANPTFGFRLGTSGDAIDVDFASIESTPGNASSPVATAGASGSRALDNISLAISAFPWSATENTVLGIVRSRYPGVQYWMNISDGTDNNRIIIDTQTANRAVRTLVQTSGSVVVNSGVVELPPLADNDYYIGVGLKANDVAMVANGGSAVTDTSASMPTVTTIRLGGARTTTNGVAYIKKLVFLPRRMTNTEIQAWTTPDLFVTSGTPATDVVARVDPDSSSVYFFTPFDDASTDSRHVRWQVEKSAGPLWCLQDLHLCRRSSEKDFPPADEISDTGENWLAVKEEYGAGSAASSLFIGGHVHGNQISSAARLYVDNVQVSLERPVIHVGTAIRFEMDSQLITKADDTTPIFDVETVAEFTASGMEFTQTLTALQDVEIYTMYMAMLSLHRYMALITGNTEVVSNYSASPDYVDGVTGTESTPLQSARLVMEGPVSGIQAEIEMTAGWTDGNRGSWIQVGSSSRKIYTSPIGVDRNPTLSVLTNDVFTTTAMYKIIAA